jgi:hypothetical protein
MRARSNHASPGETRSAGGQSYTGTGGATSAPVTCLPGLFGGSAVLWRPAAFRAGREVQRWVHAHVSRQYQRRSGHALPPSATIWSPGKRMPHIQQDLTAAGSSPCRIGRLWPMIACSPGNLPARAVTWARAAGPSTGAVLAPSGSRGRPAAWPASRASGRPPISHMPASSGQLGFICGPPIR